MKHTLSLFALAAAMPAFAETSRQLDAHEHGVGALNIAIDGSTVAMEFHAPGADIVGFEYEAESDADLAAIETAKSQLRKPLDLFVISDAADCTVLEAVAELESEDEHDDHGGGDHAEDDHDDHDDHGEHAKDDDHDEHAEHEEHDGHTEHGDHDEHAKESGHTEFHAEYTLNCDNPDAFSEITFAYFEVFPNAKEVEVQIITSSGAEAFEVEHDVPVLDLER